MITGTVYWVIYGVMQENYFHARKLQRRISNIPYDFSSWFDISSRWLLIFPAVNNAMMNMPRIPPTTNPNINIMLRLPPGR